MFRIARLPALPAQILFAWLWLFVLLSLGASARADAVNDVQRLGASGEAESALRRADKFLAVKPNDARMRFAKAVVLTDTGKRSEAIELFRQLTEDYPGLAEPYNNLAALLAASGEYDQARASLEQALRANPSYSIAQENLGDVYAMLANRSYEQALKLDPANTGLQPKLAIVRQLFKSKAVAAPSSPSQ